MRCDRRQADTRCAGVSSPTSASKRLAKAARSWAPLSCADSESDTMRRCEPRPPCRSRRRDRSWSQGVAKVARSTLDTGRVLTPKLRMCHRVLGDRGEAWTGLRLARGAVAKLVGPPPRSCLSSPVLPRQLPVEARTVRPRRLLPPRGQPTRETVVTRIPRQPSLPAAVGVNDVDVAAAYKGDQNRSPTPCARTRRHRAEADIPAISPGHCSRRSLDASGRVELRGLCEDREA
jgi:hypothetical protein